MPESLSLAEFAAERTKKTRVCRVCELPEVDEINKAYQDGVRQPTILEWLASAKGYDPDWVTRSRLGDHFRAGHGA